MRRRSGEAFKLISPFEPRGDQPAAIARLTEGLRRGQKDQVLLGVTGSGKTFTMSHIIANLNRPTLVIAPNKTLAAQLYTEFRTFFPDNAVEYFVSYYDYYQPEAYIPETDTLIEKDAAINEEIDKLRHSATRSVLTRNDCLVVASVSCIYGLGSPESYGEMMLYLREGDEISRSEIVTKLVDIQYQRNDIDFRRGTFRVRGDVIEIIPAYEEKKGIRIELFGDEVEAICEIDPLRGKVLRRLAHVAVYPSSHYVAPEATMKRAIAAIREELDERIAEFLAAGKLLEAQRLETRTRYDLELLEEIGFCRGIENYSRHLDGRRPGEPPATLLDYFPQDFLLFIDESHITIPQLHGMYRGDRARKETLVEHGFRLPSALDNRPLRFEEFCAAVNQVVYVSATPGPYEIERCGGNGSPSIVEQVIRPTGLMDPEIEVRPAAGQVDDLLSEIRARVARQERVLVTTLTKRMAEHLTEYYREVGVRVRYLHADIDTLTRTEIIRDLRLGEFDVLVGINLLREGLDLPEVSLVAILDADKEGFLRSERSLIQTCGRAARNAAGKVILYGDEVTDAMARAISETKRRREIQATYNARHGITPETIRKAIPEALCQLYEADDVEVADPPKEGGTQDALDPDVLEAQIERLTRQMELAAERLAFEEAAVLRDEIRRLQRQRLDARGIR